MNQCAINDRIDSFCYRGMGRDPGMAWDTAQGGAWRDLGERGVGGRGRSPGGTRGAVLTGTGSHDCGVAGHDGEGSKARPQR